MCGAWGEGLLPPPRPLLLLAPHCCPGGLLQSLATCVGLDCCLPSPMPRLQWTTLLRLRAGLSCPPSTAAPAAWPTRRASATAARCCCQLPRPRPACLLARLPWLRRVGRAGADCQQPTAFPPPTHPPCPLQSCCRWPTTACSTALTMSTHLIVTARPPGRPVRSMQPVSVCARRAVHDILGWWHALRLLQLQHWLCFGSRRPEFSRGHPHVVHSSLQPLSKVSHPVMCPLATLRRVLQ
jgi:hypothetical protein